MAEPGAGPGAWHSQALAFTSPGSDRMGDFLPSHRGSMFRVPPSSHLHVGTAPCRVLWEPESVRREKSLADSAPPSWD